MRRPTIYWTYLLLVVLYGLGAYSIAGVPLQWLSMMGFITLAFRLLLSRSSLRLPPGFGVLIFFLFFALASSMINIAGNDVAHLLPEKATTSYFGYIFLRFLTLIAFMAAIICTYTVAELVSMEQVSEDIVIIAVCMSLYAFYIYKAQTSGWWEPPRTRAGTDGGSQNVVFSYAFHRAMGSFREPSHLAEWLVFPFFLSTNARRYSVFKSFTIMAALLLTGSLTGMLAVCVGMTATAVMHFARFAHFIAKTYRLVVPILAAGVIFSVMAKTGSGYGGFIDTMWRRIEPVIKESDVKKTNRDYVFRYFEEHRASIFGEGVGNANIIFSSQMHVDSTVSFLNLYINTLFSLGYVGLIVLGFLLGYPLLLRLTRTERETSREMIMIWGAYFGWLLIFSAHSEEFNIIFGILYGMTICGLTQRQPSFEESDYETARA